MLRELEVRDFTVFAEAQFSFSKDLNIIVGGNGLGKTHMLDAAYCVLDVSAYGARDSGSDLPTKSYLQTALANKLRDVYRPGEVGRLVRLHAESNRSRVTCGFADPDCSLEFSFGTDSKNEVSVDFVPKKWVQRAPVYFPTFDLFDMYHNVASVNESPRSIFEAFWWDTIVLLGAPPAIDAHSRQSRELLQPLDELIGGEVKLDPSGHFYLETNMGRFGMPMLAEGQRMLATIARLITNGILLDKGYLFWDEPETRLNPTWVKVVARTILNISRMGIQVFIATHSLFLLRELYILQQTEFRNIETRHFGLHRSSAGVIVRQGQTVEDIGDIAMLDEELMQSDRYLKLP